ncbi:MAG: hypothetical protein ACK5JO_15615 [Halodesulfovibrio sp.]
MPDTKPCLAFDDTVVCAACQAHATKYEGDRAIDWEAREQQSTRLLEEVKAQKAPCYDARGLVRRYDLQPVSDEYVNAFCAFLDWDRDWYEQVMERYSNRDIWKKDDH